MAKDKYEDYSSTESSNTDVGGVNIQGSASIANGDNALRELMSHTADHYAQATISDSATPDLGANAAHNLIIAGTTTQTAYGTVKAGTVKFVRYSGARTLTHNATSFILPGAANITTIAGDTAIWVSEGSGNWRCLHYQRADGGIITSATQAEAEAGTSATKPVTPSVQHFHPSAAKFWGYVTVSAGTPSLVTSYNVTSITDTGVGRLTVTIANDFSSANWAGFVSGRVGTDYPTWSHTSKAAGSVEYQATYRATGSTDTFTDPGAWDFGGFGDI